ncbi:hypothetical protein TBLA_0D03460 [Henningerozyma blattae CBS 6284]|uniref:Uncharacterized protein n=1 Tax=Henningerozyma blattae (strain ATCC 34711 / CBS 6284 / DSM 70876 / NBRC 10599 / NRRL Y-10934 / UCD 77-7) TaxID=1071380 RepID=I2H394_HENB6|nr:hypothetical protein TBLA_0D03460 [Tetrapisispora blattae CBS 6284]CCH60846.1 hypothetical protein TBLA_0D03460 [Tetrapisispora blattae CBS 6284]
MSQTKVISIIRPAPECTLDNKVPEETTSQLNITETIYNMSNTNVEILTQIVKELSVSICKPIHEFLDNILEKFMFPKSTMKLTSNDINILGNARILEIIYLNSLIDKNVLNNYIYPIKEDKSNLIDLINVLQRIHEILIMFLNELNQSINHNDFIKEFLIHELLNFETIFKSFKKFDSIMIKLFESFQLTVKHINIEFSVNQCLLTEIQTFIKENKSMYNQLIINSNGFVEYCKINEIPRTSSLSVKANIINDHRFNLFINKRKDELQLTARRIF